MTFPPEAKPAGAWSVQVSQQLLRLRTREEMSISLRRYQGIAPDFFLSLAQLLKQSTDSAGIKRQELCGFPRLVNGVPLQYFGNTFYII